jgi:hypothetical protein
MKRLGLAFTEDDMALLRKLQAKLSDTLGKVSYVAVIRWALRKVAE